MTSKFSELAVGQPFRFEGDNYVKTTPMMARQEANGQQRFIPRSALVETATSVVPPAPVVLTRELAAPEVLRAWQAFQQRCNEVINKLDTETRLRVRRELAAAQAEFEQTLGLRSTD